MKRVMGSSILVLLSLVFGVVLTGCPPESYLVVPNITGFDATTAGNTIRGAGLLVGEVYLEFNDSIPFEYVTRTIPPQGTIVPPGTIVDVVFSGGPRNTTVPSLAGRTQSEAQDILRKSRLGLGNVSEEASATVAAGRVIRQTPNAGATVEAFTEVDIVISRGVQTRTVPNVVGLSQAAATTSIVNAGFIVGTVTQQFSITVPAGNVISQSPTAGATASGGTAVSLVVSRGPEDNRVQVPDLRGQAGSDVQGILADVGLVRGTVTEVYNASVPIGLVISSTPAHGTLVNRGTTVSVVLSLGPEPIAIDDVNELQKIGNDAGYPLNGNYFLSRDINAGATAGWDNGKGFVPLGSVSNRFTGTFDGRGFAISGLSINRETTDYVGLFAYLGAGSVVKDLTLQGGAFIGRDYVGGIAGFSNVATIENCETSLAARGRNYVGGIVGSSSGTVDFCASTAAITGTTDYTGGIAGWSSGTIVGCYAGGSVVGRVRTGGIAGKSTGSVTDCVSEAEVSGSGDYAGGVTGVNEGALVNSHASGTIMGSDGTGGLSGYSSGSISICSATGDVTSRSSYSIGGLVGHLEAGTIIQSFATGDVEGISSCGGLVGYSETGLINQCYALGSVTGRNSGGLVGGVVRGSISQCFAAGAVDPRYDHPRGGLFGVWFRNSDAPTVVNSFWDIQGTNVNESATSLGSGRSTQQMRTAATFTSAGWDFVNTWGIVPGVSYPFLLWELQD